MLLNIIRMLKILIKDLKRSTFETVVVYSIECVFIYLVKFDRYHNFDILCYLMVKFINICDEYTLNARIF